MLPMQHNTKFLLSCSRSIKLRNTIRSISHKCASSIARPKVSFPFNHSLFPVLHVRQFSLDANELLALRNANAATAVPPKEAGSFSVIPVPGKSFGAEINGIQGLEHALTLSSKLPKLINAHKVLVFRQLATRLTPSEHVSFAQIFGKVSEEMSKPPEYLKKGVHLTALTQDGDNEASTLAESILQAHDKSPYPPSVFRVVRKPDEEFAFGEGWHTDLTFRSDPPKYATLAARILPPSSGDTLFVDMGAVYNNLDDNIKLKLTDEVALHTDRAGNDVYHPIVRIHPDTGEKVLFVNSHFTKWQDNPLLESLVLKPSIAEEANESHFYRHEWQEGDLLMWDEIATQHNADGGSYQGYYRECHRVLVHGE